MICFSVAGSFSHGAFAYERGGEFVVLARKFENRLISESLVHSVWSIRRTTMSGEIIRCSKPPIDACRRMGPPHYHLFTLSLAAVVAKEYLRSGAPTILLGLYGHGRTRLKLDFEVGFGLTNGFYFGPR